MCLLGLELSLTMGLNPRCQQGENKEDAAQNKLHGYSRAIIFASTAEPDAEERRWKTKTNLA